MNMTVLTTTTTDETMVVDSAIKRSQSMWSFSNRQYSVSGSPDLLRSNSIVSGSNWSLSDGHTTNSRGFVGRFRKRGKNKPPLETKRFSMGPCLSGDVDAVDSNGRSLLFYAARYGQTETAEQLIQTGCSPNQKDKLHNTPLHESIEKGHLDIAEIFLRDGKADVNILGFNGDTPLMSAVSRGQIDAVRLLDKYGADINICDATGNPPIYRAMQRGWNEIAQFLLERQCDVNKTTANGMTCFFAAAHCNKIDIVTVSRRLLKCGYNFKMDVDWLETEGCPVDIKEDAKVYKKLMDRAGIKTNVKRRKSSLLSSGKRKLIKSFRRLSSTDSSRSDSS